MNKKVLNKTQLLQLMGEKSSQISRFGVSRLGLFGSCSRNEMTVSSDVDLIVDFLPGAKTYDNFIALAYYLEDAFGRRVELITPESISRHLKPYILKDIEYVNIAA